MRAKDCAVLLLTIAAFVRPAAAQAGPAGITSARAATVATVPAALRFLPDVRCVHNRFGFRECASGDYQLSGDPEVCAIDGFFGRVFVRGGVDVLDRFDRGARVVARLHDRQFVCVGVQAGREPGVATWNYVIAVPTRDVPDCRGVRLCRNADFPVRWSVPPPAVPCRLHAGGHYSNGCAAGWVRTENLDLYANGIRPIGE